MFQNVVRNHVLNKANLYARRVDALRESMQKLSDADLKAKTVEFKDKLKQGFSVDSISVEAFAVAREASKRVCGLEPYFVQLVSGFVLLWGNISEQYTGEGKSLVALLPSYVMGMVGDGVHIVTVNDYLAGRDAHEVGDIARWLGLSVGCVFRDMLPDARKKEYACDITYITNNELGFDYLRDNMVYDLSNCVQRGLNYAIIDEADSILIDEARTPLIISNPVSRSNKLYEMCDYFVGTLEQGEYVETTKMDILSGAVPADKGDFIVNEKDKVVYLTERGVSKVEEYFHLDNFADDDHSNIHHHVVMALKAHYLMHRDHDYVVDNGEVIIVDDFTGRVMPGRRYGDGLHQAIEAKEHVEVKDEFRTSAEITFQNFFNKYKLKSGMTGTALTEANEFKSIYNMNVVRIPTNKPVIREDLPDKVFVTAMGKYKAVVNAVLDAYHRRQPVLVGTPTIEVSEKLSAMFSEAGISHAVLNAKLHAEEAEIVSHAGEVGRVTIATNMAGRGTDIKLNDEARANGGLFVIGTEHHEARRIDNQLRGRSGRQGDPGKSQFYVSLEDDVMRLFASDSAMAMYKSLGFSDDQPIVHPMLSRTIENAQKHIEDNNFGIRKSLMDYDSVNNEHRELIYEQRRRVLSSDDIRSDVLSMLDAVVKDSIHANTKDGVLDCDRVVVDLNNIVGRESMFDGLVDTEDVKEVESILRNRLHFLYNGEIETVKCNGVNMNALERFAVVHVLDGFWMKHMDDLEQLKQGIGLLGYGQQNPVVAYRGYAYDMLDVMLMKLRTSVVHKLFTAHSVVRNAVNALDA